MKKILFLITLGILINLAFAKDILAIGQMSQPIVLENVLRGQTIEETLILYGSEDKEDIYGLMAEGQIKDWTKFYLPDNPEQEIKEISIPAKAQVNAIARFTVPEDAPNGVYTGVVALFLAPQSGQEEGVSVGVGLRVDREVSIAVTDKEIVSFETSIIPKKYFVKQGEALKIKVIYDNQGNVSIKPDIHLKVVQISTENTVHNAIYPYPEGEEAVRAFDRKTFDNLIEWQTAGQEKGKYKAEIEVLLNGEIIKEESFRFDIGYSNSNFLAAIALIGGGNLTIAWLVIGAIFVILAIILTIISKKGVFKKVRALR